MDPSFRAGLPLRNVNAPIYFPPPPTGTTTAPETKKAVKLNLSKPRPSTETTSSTSSAPGPKSILKQKSTSTSTSTPTKRHRQWMLLSLLVISFTILIVSMIFAYCAALPHSDNLQAAQEALNSNSSDLEHRDTPRYPSDTSYNKTIEEALAEDVANREKFNQPSAMAALTFYTATLPLLTIIHTSTELLTSLIRPQTSQNTRLGDALRFRSSKHRVSTLLSFAASAILCLGWFIMQLFWLNCEISLFSSSSEGVCPVQIRGHRMGGVSELSIGKISLAFTVILGYLGYCLYLVKCVGVFGSKKAGQGSSVSSIRMASFGRRARFARGERVRVPDEASDGGVETVVIGIDVEKGLK